MRGVPGLLLLASAALGQTAAQHTDRGRGLRVVLDALVYPENAPARSIQLVVDPTPSLKSARFAETLDTLMRVRRARAPRPGLGISIVGSKTALPPGATAEAITAAAETALQRPKLEVRNVYAAVRGALPLLRSAPGRREIVLVTLENGDLEDDLEKSVAAARKAGVRIHVLAREAFLSDTYWQWRTPPRGKGSYRGADGAFIDIPWGWVFQQYRVTEAAPAGHAMYGLSRLAAATEGRVFVWYPKRGKHVCQLTGSCTFCPNDHVAPLEVVRAPRVRAIAPSVAARKDVLAEAGKDGYYRAVLAAWEASAKAGLVRTYPSVRRAGKKLVPDTARTAPLFSWTGTSWKRFGRQASKMAKAADRIAGRLAADLARAKGSERSRSIAELTYLMLRITRVNLLLCAAYCKELAPRKGQNVEPPERELVGDDYRITGLGYRNLSLCHGMAPYEGLELPGGEKVRKEVMALAGDLRNFHRRNAYSPFAIAAARMGIATFHPVGIGKKTTPLPRDVSGTDSAPTTTRPDRGGGTSGGSTGPTSGGG
ncbi:MAG: hypothetical protein ACYTHK_18590 [Planctomycetota bacterium]|jgi:hypothetical protein